MKRALAQRLLARVMDWTPAEAAHRLPVTQAMASYKYDEYQQFSPGMRFVESLAMWLSQFKTNDERRVAYDFALERLIFFSNAELRHFVSIAYPDFIRPLLLRSTAHDLSLPEWHVATIAESTEFRIRERQCLFLGLSDGARVDVFRRDNRVALDHEQISLTYELSDGRVKELLDHLEKRLKSIVGGPIQEDMRRFRTVVLLDDFSASGISYLRLNSKRKYAGKIATFYDSVIDSSRAVHNLFNLHQLEVLVVLYVATERAVQHLRTHLDRLWNGSGITYSILVVCPLPREIERRPGIGDDLENLMDAYYDSRIEHGSGMPLPNGLKYGFADCGLPVVLSHNTPNNSLAIIWAPPRPLFPRIQRHGVYKHKAYTYKTKG